MEGAWGVRVSGFADFMFRLLTLTPVHAGKVNRFRRFRVLGILGLYFSNPFALNP